MDGGFGLLKDDESLALGLQVGLSDYVDDISILGEYGGQGGFQNVRLDTLLKIPYIDAT